MSRSRLLAVVLTLALAPAVVLTAQQTVSPLDVRLFSGSQAVVLLFDLSVLQGEDLQHAAETAKRPSAACGRGGTSGSTSSISTR